MTRQQLRRNIRVIKNVFLVISIHRRCRKRQNRTARGLVLQTPDEELDGHVVLRVALRIDKNTPL